MVLVRPLRCGPGHIKAGTGQASSGRARAPLVRAGSWPRRGRDSLEDYRRFWRARLGARAAAAANMSDRPAARLGVGVCRWDWAAPVAEYCLYPGRGRRTDTGKGARGSQQRFPCDARGSPRLIKQTIQGLAIPLRRRSGRPRPCNPPGASEVACPRNATPLRTRPTPNVLHRHCKAAQVDPPDPVSAQLGPESTQPRHAPSALAGPQRWRAPLFSAFAS